MDAASALTTDPTVSWAVSPSPLGARTHALEAAASPDLPQHLSDLTERGELAAFLAQTDTAVALAESAPVFGEQLEPLLNRIRDGLSQLPTEQLPAVDRDAVVATLGRLDAHLGPAAGPEAGGEVPGGGLQVHEDAGGHLLERHVGKSDQSLVERVRNENISAASSFRDLPEAEHFVAATLAEHHDRIDAWLGGEGGNRMVVDARFDASTGRSVARGESEAEDVFSVRLVLERSDRLDIGYRIVTGYPSAP